MSKLTPRDRVEIEKLLGAYSDLCEAESFIGRSHSYNLSATRTNNHVATVSVWVKDFVAKAAIAEQKNLVRTELSKRRISV